MQTPIDVYIPEAVYTENIATIAKKNTELMKNISVRLGKMSKKDAAAVYEEEQTDNENLIPIEIFIPASN